MVFGRAGRFHVTASRLRALLHLGTTCRRSRSLGGEDAAEGLREIAVLLHDAHQVGRGGGFESDELSPRLSALPVSSAVTAARSMVTAGTGSCSCFAFSTLPAQPLLGLARITTRALRRSAQHLVKPGLEPQALLILGRFAFQMQLRRRLA